MKNFHETTDGLIIPFDKVLLMKKNLEFIRVVFVGGGNEENIIGNEDMKIFERYKKWLDLIFAYKFGVVKADSEHKVIFKVNNND